MKNLYSMDDEINEIITKIYAIKHTISLHEIQHALDVKYALVEAHAREVSQRVDEIIKNHTTAKLRI
jgi:hypothetical protein